MVSYVIFLFVFFVLVASSVLSLGHQDVGIVPKKAKGKNNREKITEKNNMLKNISLLIRTGSIRLHVIGLEISSGVSICLNIWHLLCSITF